MNRPTHWGSWTLLGLAVLAVLLASLGMGAVALGPADVAAALQNRGDELARAVVLELRLPRALAAFAVGASLALAGLLLQALFRNPLADPYVLGVSGGAAVGALVAMSLGAAAWSVSGGAFAGAVLAGLLVFGFGVRVGTHTALLLAGVVVAACCGAVVTLLLTIADATQLRGMVFWLAGDLSQVQSPWAPLLLALVATLIAGVFGPPLDALASGELRARSIGLDVDLWRKIVFAAAATLTAAAVVTAGTIGFVGLLGAHGARALLRTADHRRLAPATALLGGTCVAAADLVARTALEPRQLPVGGVLALIGAPLFLLLLRRASR
jgi:iron complex transport system permease protein